MKEKDIEYCLSTNCLGCENNKGSYKECKYFERKKNAMRLEQFTETKKKENEI